MMENHKKNEKPCRRIRCNNEHTWWGKRNKGFTLAELLIVVAIIAVLVAISIPIFKNQLEKNYRIDNIYKLFKKIFILLLVS